MSREKNLIKNTAILSLGTFVPKFITVFITPILTARLTKAEYGSYDLVVTLVALLLPATTLQISSAAFRFLIDQKENKLKCKKIISSIFTFVVVTSTSVSYTHLDVYKRQDVEYVIENFKEVVRVFGVA